MSGLLIVAFGLAILAQAQLQPDGPISTQPRQIIESTPDASSPPEDSVGYVAWCRTTLEGYVGLYERVMPEVTRIERAFPSPEGGATASLAVYPQLRDTAREDIDTFNKALDTAKAATPLDIEPQINAGTEAGTVFWANAATARTADVARVWMSWSPPERCAVEADKLAHLPGFQNSSMQSSGGESISDPPVTVSATPAPQGEQPPAEPDAQTSPTVIASPVDGAAPEAKPIGLRRISSESPDSVPSATSPVPASNPATPEVQIPAEPETRQASARPEPLQDFVYDPAKPKPCPGRLEPIKRKGKSVMMCRVAKS